jgi:type 2 lantibiotic biosynthesis protein LanM
MRIDMNEPEWYAGLTLLERHALLPHPETAAAAMDDEDGDARGAPATRTPEMQHRWRCWRQDGPLAQQRLLARRLAADGLSEGRLRQVVHTPVEAVRRACHRPPGWLRTLSDAVESVPTERQAVKIRDVCKGFLALVEPLVGRAFASFQTKVRDTLRHYRYVPFTPQTVDRIFFDGLEQQLLTVVSRTLVLELNVARLRGELRGTTPAARFSSFVASLRDPAIATRVFKEYPVLARIVIDVLTARVAFQVQFLHHLALDWHSIVIRWPGLTHATLRQVSGALGDPHRGGRAVVRVSFHPRGELIYKPKSLAIEKHMQQLLRWLNAHGTRHPFRTLRLIDRGERGWIECLRNDPCETPEQVSRFYERLGGLLAVLYALHATDFHYENLIACGEYPMLVDLEALFHAEATMPGDGSAHSSARESLWRSVLRVGLLPQRIWSGDGFEGIDLSGLGGEPGQRLPQRVPGWEAAGTDEMRMIDQDGRLPAARNRPTLLGEPVDVLAHTDAFERGFVEMYLLLRHNRDALLSQTGPIHACGHDEIRTILRPTRVYTWLLQERVHPDVLRNGLDQDRLLDWLWRDVATDSRLAHVVTAEREDLRHGDVPYFTTTPTARAIWTSEGQKIPRFHDRSGITCVEQLIRDLSDGDLDRQLWYLRASFTSLARPREELADVPLTGPPAAPARPEDYLHAARQVGKRLERLAFVTDTEASWMGVSLMREQHWSLVPAGVDLYSGLPGIAMFLARLSVATRERRYGQLARKALAGALRQMQSVGAWPTVGVFAGQAGMVYALTHVGLLLWDSALIDHAERLVSSVRESLPADTHFDLISGAAGAILGLAALHDLTGSPAALGAIQTAADHLVAHAERVGDGVGWRTPLGGDAPLVGASHGAGGIALALLTAWGLIGDPRFERTARLAMAYERGLFSEEGGNWPDLRPRTSAAERLSMTAWCHGAAGIGLARLAGLRYADDSNIRDDIAHAVHATLAHGFGRNHSLCHGDLGNLELIAGAAARVDEPGLRSSAACFAANVLRDIHRRGWRCGVPLQVETPGLMTGLAGIGDGLLRLWDPQLPSLLMVQAP